MKWNEWKTKYNNKIRLKFKIHNAMMGIINIRHIFARYESSQSSEKIHNWDSKIMWQEYTRIVSNAHQRESSRFVSGYTTAHSYRKLEADLGKCQCANWVRKCKLILKKNVKRTSIIELEEKGKKHHPSCKIFHTKTLGNYFQLFCCQSNKKWIKCSKQDLL